MADPNYGFSSFQAAAIRKQVEYYFSDDNLETDRFLQKKMKGQRNLPISLAVICDFKKMRQYPRAAVEAALRDNGFVNLVELDIGWCVQRKEPFISMKELEAIAGIKKPKTKPTGFEEYWTDPPITPEESVEEKNLYNLDNPFAERIETAIQRFQAKRRFKSHARNIFDKWMRLGGIDSGQKQFSGGLDSSFLEDNTADEILTMTATNFVNQDMSDENGEPRWAVDFNAVAKSFLSSIVPAFWTFESQADVRECVNILRNFYNYILHHNVCPEHAAGILAARDVCDLADTQLLSTPKVLKLFPGQFNVACSTLFGGFYRGLYAGDQDWSTRDQTIAYDVGLSTKQAKQVLAMAIAVYGSAETVTIDREENQKRLFHQTIIHSEENAGLEVTEIIAAPEEARQLYDVKVAGGLKPLGKLVCKPWTVPDFDASDLPLGFLGPSQPNRYEFWIEQHILDWCFVGMKIETTVHTLSGGVQFFDYVSAVKCSFYMPLENELLQHWKEPKWISREEQLARDNKGQDDDEVPGMDEID